MCLPTEAVFKIIIQPIMYVEYNYILYTVVVSDAVYIPSVIIINKGY